MLNGKKKKQPDTDDLQRAGMYPDIPDAGAMCKLGRKLQRTRERCWQKKGIRENRNANTSSIWNNPPSVQPNIPDSHVVSPAPRGGNKTPLESLQPPG